MAAPSEPDLTQADPAELELRLAEIRTRMQPLEASLAELRAQRDQILTEVRRRERLEHMQRRQGVKAAMRSGELLSLSELLASVREGSFDDYAYNLKTGGEVRLGFPGARSQTVAFTDGRQAAQARDLADAARYYEAGWEPGSPGRPGIRVHFTGTRQERLAPPDEVFARPQIQAPASDIS